MGKIVSRVCPICKERFHVYKSELKHGRGKRCSGKCDVLALYDEEQTKKHNKREYMKKYYQDNSEKRKKYMKEYREKNPEKFKGYRKKHKKKYYQENPGKERARQKANRAIRDGILIKQPCEVCGELKVEAHHDDYTKPFEVRWLCKKCHEEHHVNYKRAVAEARSELGL